MKKKGQEDSITTDKFYKVCKGILAQQAIDFLNFD